MNAGEKTLFQQKAESYQNEQLRTKGAGIVFGVTVLGVSIVALVVSAIMQFALQEMCGVIACILPVIMIVSAIGIPVGVGITIVNAVRPTKEVTCPRCGQQHRIYRNANKYMCPNCKALLLLGKDPKVMPQLSACPYCGLQTPVTADHGRFICPNCGVVRDSVSASVLSPPQHCTECGQSVPEGAIYCKACGHILKSDFSQPALGDPALAYDQDWTMGKDPVGHYHYARALLKGIRQGIPPGANITLVQSLLTNLESALLSIEEAWRAPALQTHIATMLPEVDLTYANLLEFELRSIQALDPKAKLAKDALKALAEEPHITARKRVEGLLGASLHTAGSIGAWREKIVTVEQGDKYSRVKSYELLAYEVARFREWWEQRTAEGAR